MAPEKFDSLLEASAYLDPSRPSRWNSLRAKAVARALELGCDPDTLTEVPVDWAFDQDANNHVNSIIYGRYGQLANTRNTESYAQIVGDERVRRMLRGENEIGPIAKDMYVRYKRSASYPDSILVGTRLMEVKNDSYRIMFVLWSLKEQFVVAEITCWIVFLDFKTARPVDLTMAKEPYSPLYNFIKSKAQESQEKFLEYIRKHQQIKGSKL